MTQRRVLRMKLLREAVRRLIMDVYDLNDDELATKRSMELEKGFGADHLRAMGLQSSPDQEADRTYLQQYQEDVTSDSDGKKMIKKFQNGEYTILHSMRYDGTMAYSNVAPMKDNEPLSSEWMEKYGRKGKDQLSCVAFPAGPTKSLSPPNNMNSGNYMSVIEQRGLILKGYPVYVSQEDVMSTTLGALSDRHKEHQEQSGLAKRVAHSDEVILDNWTVTGTYISLDEWDISHRHRVIPFIQDSITEGLPCNVYEGYSLVVRIRNQNQLDSFITKISKD